MRHWRLLDGAYIPAYDEIIPSRLIASALAIDDLTGVGGPAGRTQTRIGIYLRVSTLEQARRQSIETQRLFAARYCELHELGDVEVYADDGTSGVLPFRKRPEGARLLRDAEAGRLSAVYFYKLDRIGRSTRVILDIHDRLVGLGIAFKSMTESFDTSTSSGRLAFGVLSNVAEFEHDTIVERTVEGSLRVAAEGHPMGGVVPFGFKKVGLKQEARYEIDDDLLSCGVSPRAIVIRMYERIGYDRWTCWQVAQELQALGVPTVYARTGRAMRQQRVQNRWLPGRIRNMVTNSSYRGVGVYRKHAAQPIVVPMPRIVSDELWDAAQETLALHRSRPHSGSRAEYLLRGVMVCALCGKNYCGSPGRKGEPWFRCSGYMSHRGPKETRCIGKPIKGEPLQQLVWDDIERWLRNPGEIIWELDAEAEAQKRTSPAADQRTILRAQLEELGERRRRAGEAYVDGAFDRAELTRRVGEIDAAKRLAQAKLEALRMDEENDDPEPIPQDLLDRVRRELDTGLEFALRQEIVRNLVRRIVVQTTVDEKGHKEARVEIEYRFPVVDFGVVATRTGTRSDRSYTNLQRVVCV